MGEANDEGLNARKLLPKPSSRTRLACMTACITCPSEKVKPVQVHKIPLALYVNYVIKKQSYQSVDAPFNHTEKPDALVTCGHLDHLPLI